jgi:hypothetical protein
LGIGFQEFLQGTGIVYLHELLRILPIHVREVIKIRFPEYIERIEKCAFPAGYRIKFPHEDSLRIEQQVAFEIFQDDIEILEFFRVRFAVSKIYVTLVLENDPMVVQRGKKRNIARGIDFVREFEPVVCLPGCVDSTGDTLEDSFFLIE